MPDSRTFRRGVAARPLRALRVNVLGSWYCAQLFGQRMLADGKGGTIVNVSSILGSIGWPDFAPASQTSKAAIENMTRNLACSWGNRRAWVNTLSRAGSAPR
jgi:3-oxoacyl-[acyl-carrier protein] reductase